MATLTENDIRSWVHEQEYWLGQSYYARGYLIDPLRDGEFLRAKCHGSRIRPYDLWVKADERGIKSAKCSCPYGKMGRCRHVTALLFAWMHQPESFREAQRNGVPLVEWFGRYLTQIFAQRSYRVSTKQYVADFYQHCKELTGRYGSPNGEPGSRFLPLSMQKFLQLHTDPLSLRVEEMLDRKAFLDFEQVSEGGGHVIIIGEELSSWSTVLYQWALSLAELQATATEPSHLPILLDGEHLRVALEQQATSLVRALIESSLQEQGLEAFRGKFLETGLDKGRHVIFVCDIDINMPDAYWRMLTEEISSLCDAGNRFVFGLTVPEVNDEIRGRLNVLNEALKIGDADDGLLVQAVLLISIIYKALVYADLRQTKVLDMASDFDWSRQFVPLFFHEYRPRSFFTNIAAFEQYTTQRSPIEPSLIFARTSLIWVLGEAGSGKTTLLTKWALTLIEEPKTILVDRSAVPFFLSLAELKELPSRLTREPRIEPDPSVTLGDHHDELGLIDCLRAKLADYHIKKHAQGYLDSLLRHGQCVIFLDGLDEIPNSDVAWLVDEIQAFLKLHLRAGNTIVLSSRVPGARESMFRLPANYALEVAEFSGEDVELFITGWFHDDAVKAKSLLKQIQDSNQLQEIAFNPLLLTIIASNEEHEFYDLPSKRTGLYDYCMGILIERWDLDRGLHRLDFPAELCQRALERLALALQMRGAQTFSRNDLWNILNEACDRPDFDLKKHEVDHMVRQVLGIQTLIRQVTANLYRFRHTTFQEYLAASAIVKDQKLGLPPGIDLLIQHAFEPRWHDVIVLASGDLDDSTELLSGLIDTYLRNSSPPDEFAILLGKCLREAKSVTNDNIRDWIFAMLIKQAWPWEVVQ